MSFIELDWIESGFKNIRLKKKFTSNLLGLIHTPTNIHNVWSIAIASLCKIDAKNGRKNAEKRRIPRVQKKPTQFLLVFHIINSNHYSPQLNAMRWKLKGKNPHAIWLHKCYGISHSFGPPPPLYAPTHKMYRKQHMVFFNSAQWFSTFFSYSQHPIHHNPRWPKCSRT